MQQQFCVLPVPVLQKPTSSAPWALFQTRGKALNTRPQTHPEASRAGVQHHGQHRVLQGSLLGETRILVECRRHTSEPVQLETCFLVAGIAYFLFPAGGEVSNVKEHARLFSQACQGNASSLSPGKM